MKIVARAALVSLVLATAAHAQTAGALEAQYLAPHVSAQAGPVSVAFDGQTYVNKGLVGVGRLAAAARDFTGDSLGSFSGLALDRAKWGRRKDGTYAGVLYT